MDGYPLLNVFLTMMWLFLWTMRFLLLFKAVTDLLRDEGGQVSYPKHAAPPKKP
ncbi:hypothetical protein ACFWWC_17440 [Streptomyces sp. NPDC058642]|uniref:hypothetical protein n=1 Tax=Streptomyces sp. NPDC058642 TaxID=3346572 RepID=UPI00365A8C45